jgi:hypothetical protein
MMSSLTDFIVNFGRDPFAVGLVSLFGFLAGIEFLVRYAFRSAKLMKLLASLGIKRAKKTQRKNLQFTLYMVRRSRTESGLRAFESLIRESRLMMVAILVIILITFIVTMFWFEQERYVFIASLVGSGLRYIVAGIISFPTSRFIHSMARNPNWWRQKTLLNLRKN